MTWIELEELSNERVLLCRIRDGDQEAFRTLFETYHVDIFRFCMLLVGDAVLAEDIHQETFLALYRACRSGDDIRSVRGLLITIARNRCLDQLKIAGRHVGLEEAVEQSYEPPYENIDMDEHLWQALGQIAPQYREALMLFEIEGYSYKEISQQLGISLHAVKNRIYLAKRQLRVALAPIFDR